MDKKALLAAAAALAATVSLSQQALATPVVAFTATTEVTLDHYGRPIVDGKLMVVSRDHSAMSRMKLADNNNGCNSGCGSTNTGCGSTTPHV